MSKEPDILSKKTNIASTKPYLLSAHISPGWYCLWVSRHEQMDHQKSCVWCQKIGLFLRNIVLFWRNIRLFLVTVAHRARFRPVFHCFDTIGTLLTQYRALLTQLGLFWRNIGLFWDELGSFDATYGSFELPSRIVLVSVPSAIVSTQLGLLWRNMGLFWHIIGLFWQNIGLFWHIIGLFWQHIAYSVFCSILLQSV